MKKAFVLLLVLLALSTIAMHEAIAVTETYLSDAPAPTETSGGIVLEPCEPILFIGETIQLKASGAESILWSTSDPAVATVDEKGVVTAVAAGEVTITACSAQDSNIRADATFMVGVHTEAVKLEETELVLVAGTSDKADYDLIPQILPEDALVKEVTYASSNAAILTVDENGHLHAVAPGNVTVTVTSADKGCKAPAKLKVTVKQAVTGIELNKTEAELYLKEKLNLTAKVLPQNATNKKCVWSSSNEAVATVSPNGAVTATGEGKAVIRCAAEDNGEVFAECVVNVTIPVQRIVLDPANATLLLGGPQALTTAQLKSTLTPENASFQNVTWTSSDEKIATVDANGQVRGISIGKATITATTTDPRAVGKVKAVCTITVGNAVTGIELSKTEVELYLTEKLSLTAKVFPQNAVNKKCVWSSSNEKVATVTQNGAVTPMSKGVAVIRCTAEDGSKVYSECKITVTVGAQKITLDNTSATLLVGGAKELSTKQLRATVTPNDTSFKSVTWSSSDPKVATVDNTGLVRGISAGKATITAATTDARAAGRVKATCTITVGSAVTKIILEGGESRIQKEKSARFTAKVNPDKPFNGKLTWASSNENILKVDANGNVRAINVGTATITVSATDGSKVSVSKQITVYQPVTQIKPSTTKKTAVTEGKTATLSVTVLPTDATDKKIKWSSSDPSIATVDDKGTVTGKKAGTCEITAAAADGSGKSVKMTVIVEPKIPLDATTFTRSGYFGMYYEFAVTFKNLTKTRTIKYISFDLKYSYQGNTYTRNFYTDSDTLGPGSTKRIGWWNVGYELSKYSNFRIYLRTIKYSDGTWEYFSGDDSLLGWFIG